MSTAYSNIAKLCEARNITLRKLASEAGISYDTLKDLRSNKRTTVSIATACRLADYFDCPTSFFMEGTENDTTENFGIRLRLRRTAKDLTLEKLAEEVGVSLSVISNLETGKANNIKPELLLSLAKALETTPNALLGWREGMPVRQAEAKIIHQLGYLDDAEIDLLESLTTTMRSKKKK